MPKIGRFFVIAALTAAVASGMCACSDQPLTTQTVTSAPESSTAADNNSDTDKSTSDIVNMTKLSRREFTVGATVTVTGAASGGSGKYSYEFYYKRAGEEDWMPFGDDKQAGFHPESEGEFVIRTYAKDNDGNYALKDFTLKAHPAVVNKTTVSSTGFTLGDKVTVKGAAEGGMGKYTYEFYYKRKTAKAWIRFGSKSKGTFKPEAEGEFIIRTYAKDEGGGTSKKDFELTAKEKPKTSKAENS